MVSWSDAVDAVVPPQLRKRQPAPIDPYALLAGVGGDFSSSGDLYADALAQVSNQYNAQLANLDAAASQARSRQRTGDQQIASMYGALQKDIGANAKGISSIYDKSLAGTRSLQKNTKGNITSNYQETANDLGSLFARLGIQAAAPDALAQGAQDRGMFTSLADLQGQSSINALTANKAAGLNFNTAQANIAGLTGKNRRADLLTQLNETLAGIGSQRNTVMGQMADAVAQRQYQLEQDSMDRQMQLQRLMMDMYGDSAGGGADGGLTASQQYSQMGPDERGYYKASQLFGPNSAPYAMELITGVANNQNQGVYENIAHFIRSVLAENEKQQAAGNGYLDPNELQMLASYFWNEGGTGRRPPIDRSMY